MKLSYSYPYHIVLLFSLAYASCSMAESLEHMIPLMANYTIPMTAGGAQTKYEEAKTKSKEIDVQSEQGAAEQSEAVESTKQPTLADHLKDALAAGLIKICQPHQIDELSANIYSPEEGSTFSTTVSTNGDGLVDRVKRTFGTEPTIRISSNAVFTPEETEPKIRFQRALLKFAENADLPCKQKVYSNGNKVVVCTIVMELKEFLALKEQYTNSHP
jgi:hypothetical protein